MLFRCLKSVGVQLVFFDAQLPVERHSLVVVTV